MRLRYIFTYSVWLLICLSPFPALLQMVSGLAISPMRLVGIPIIALAFWFFPIKKPMLLLVVVAFIASVIISIIKYSDAMLVISEAWPYIIFFSLIIVNKRVYLDFRVITRIFALIGAIGGIICVLFVGYAQVEVLQNGGIDSLLSTGRTAVLVDASSGVFGAIASIGVMLHAKDIRNSMLGSIGLVFSFVNLALSQTRSKIIVTLILIIGSVLVGEIKKNKRFYRGLAPALLLLILGLVLAPQQIESSVGSIVDRMSTLDYSDIDSDESTYFRDLERGYEVMLIHEAPIFGQGWGLSARHKVGSETLGYMGIYGHNMYTALPARVGMPLAIIVILMLVGIVLRILNRYKREKDKSKKNDYMIALEVMLAIIMLSFTSAGLSNNNIAIATIFGIIAANQKKLSVSGEI